MSSARVKFAGAFIDRVNLKLKQVSDEIGQKSKILEDPMLDTETQAAQLTEQLRAAREDQKHAQWEFNTAAMYRNFPTVNVEKARRELAAATSRVTELESQVMRGGRGLASTTAAIEGDRNVEQATSDLSELTDLSDHYQELRQKAEYCASRAAGFPGEPAPSIDPSQNFGSTIAGSSSVPAKSVTP